MHVPKSRGCRRVTGDQHFDVKRRAGRQRMDDAGVTQPEGPGPPQPGSTLRMLAASN